MRYLTPCASTKQSADWIDLRPVGTRVEHAQWIMLPLGTPLVVALEQLDWLAKEVMSAFRSVEVAAAAE